MNYKSKTFDVKTLLKINMGQIQVILECPSNDRDLCQMPSQKLDFYH